MEERDDEEVGAAELADGADRHKTMRGATTLQTHRNYDRSDQQRPENATDKMISPIGRTSLAILFSVSFSRNASSRRDHAMIPRKLLRNRHALPS